jgi:hypothetical protein
MTDEKRDALVVIATSGSTDYLSDATGDRRFWPVTLPSREGSPPDDSEGCDGIHHDEGEPAFLCTRCFPDLSRGDLGRGHDDEDDHRDEPHERE